MRSIRDWRQEIKLLAEEAVGQWGVVLLVILVGLVSFGLGRLSAIDEIKPLVGMSQAAAGGLPSHPLGGQFVASRRGNVYYFPWCSGAQKIVGSDQIWFPSESAAEKAGFRPAKNCKGL